jgi:hypothetical protein
MLNRSVRMAQARDFSRDFGQDRGIGIRTRRFSFRRRSRPAAGPAKASRRAPFVRSDVRRGPQASLKLWTPVELRQLPATAYETLMTQRLQGTIIVAMLGLSLFFHSPLMAALTGLFR